MRSYHRADNGYPLRIAVAITCATVILLAGVSGCGSPKAAAKTGAATVSNTNSKGLPKLTASEVDEKIKAVQASTSIPESAKPKAIESIRAQGEP